MNKQIAFVVYDGLTPIDLVGPLQVMSAFGDRPEILAGLTGH